MLRGLPAFVAFSITVVPFWHGMNRHLDRCYLEKKDSIARRALLFDFGAFFAEGGLLFAAAWSLTSGIYTFGCLGLLLLLDTGWGFASHFIHYRGQRSHVRIWPVVNIGAIFISVLIVVYSLPHEIWLPMTIAICRTVVDYELCRDFYFPAPHHTRVIT